MRGILYPRWKPAHGAERSSDPVQGAEWAEDFHEVLVRVALARKADRAGLLTRSHIETSQVEVRKITLHQVFMAQQVAPPG